MTPFGKKEMSCTFATKMSVLWICVKRVGICKSSRF